MSKLSKNERIELFKNLFRGREDVFQRRWENVEKETTGYLSVYTDYHKSEYKGLSLNDIENHLFGKHTIGVYPLLEDNTSYFIVADFDKGTFKKNVKVFI